MTTITIEQAGKYEGQEVTLKGWLYNLRESGKLLFPIFRDGTGIIQGVCALKENPEAFESLKGLTQESSVIVTGKIRGEKRALPYPIKRARCRFPARSAPPLDSNAPPGRHTPNSRRSHPRRTRIHGRPGLHARRRADVHSRRLRRYFDTLRSQLHRRSKGLPHAERPTLRRSHRHGPRQGLHLWPDFPRRKIQDPSPPHGVLDAGAGSRLRRVRGNHVARRRPGERDRAIRAEK